MVLTSEFTPVEIMILTLTQELRNQTLDTDLVNGGWPPNQIRKVFGFDGKIGSYDYAPKINLIKNQKFIERQLTAPEIACVLSHRLIYSLTSYEWVLVLEDDAILLERDLQKKLHGLIKELDSDVPTVISLFAGRNGIVSSRRQNRYRKIGVDRYNKPTTGCVAYLINAKARNISLTSPAIVGVADWPTWIYACEFYQQVVPWFDTLDSKSSYISPSMPESFKILETYSIRKLFSLLLKLIDADIASVFGGRRRYYKNIIHPIVRATIFKFLSKAFTQ